MTGDEVKKENMMMGDLCDQEIAVRVRMLTRSDLDHELVCTASRDRIMYLSQRVEKLEELIAFADKEIHGDYNWEQLKQNVGLPDQKN